TLAHLDGAEARQMRGDELRVEEREATGAQPRDEMNQRDLGGVAFPVEHALAEERTAEPDTVEPADKLAVTPGFDGMAMPDLVQPAVELADPPVDPGSRTPGRGLGAAVDHGPEV